MQSTELREINEKLKQTDDIKELNHELTKGITLLSEFNQRQVEIYQNFLNSSLVISQMLKGLKLEVDKIENEKQELTESKGVLCPICFNSRVTRVLKCGHLFCHECVEHLDVSTETTYDSADEDDSDAEGTDVDHRRMPVLSEEDEREEDHQALFRLEGLIQNSRFRNRMEEFLIEDTCDVCAGSFPVDKILIKYDRYQICEGCMKQECPLCNVSQERIEELSKHVQMMREEYQQLKEMYLQELRKNALLTHS